MVLNDATPVPTDEQLVEAFRGGDQTGFRELVRRYQRTVYGLAYRAAGNHADADDLAQDIFLRVYRSLGRFRGDSAFRTWLFRIILNRLSSHRRGTARERARRTGRDPGRVAAAGSHLGTLIREEERVRLAEEVHRLPERQRDTVILRFYQGLKYREIAEVLGCSEGTAKASLFQAVRALRGRMTGGGQR
jgi:RNA polymerase sigma-70 factor (ECF subfamily)